ncbi:unnamed protein product [Adineta steineri]|uniref:SUEL-type lectin domain-containing protein n=2 Tax=Adineta steineri TaxID=433720 RepID=A0A815H2M5_9BILA|nr:unnamed protein product [Adineta steineri]
MYINKCLLVLLLCCLTLKSVNLLLIREADNRQHNQTNADPIVIEVSWTAHDYNLHTIPSLQLVTNPLVSRQFSPVSKEIFANLKQLNAEYARYAVWFPYPKLAVAELDPPSGLLQCSNVGENYPLHLSCERNGGVISQIDFASYGTAMGACGQMKQGSCHSNNSLSIVQRICIGQKSCTIIATNDIFGDPCYEYNWDYTEIFNEIEGEHQMSIEYYTRAYDAVIQGIRRHTNNYDMKYVGMALENHNEFNFYKYFLNHSNHAPDIPLDMISYHFYAIGTSRTDPQSWENFFPQLDKFTIEVEQIEQIRKNLSPQTRTTIDELGVILPNDNDPNAPLFPLIYWNAAAALYAYSWGKLSRQNIDVVGHSQLVGYPQLPNLQLEPQYPSVALLNWTTGEGTAKYWISKLLIDTADIDNDQAVITRTSDIGDQNIFSQAFTSKNNRRWILIINKRYASMDVSLSGCIGGKMQIINEASGFGPPTEITLTSNQITLTPFAIAIIHMPTAKK